MRWGMVGYEYDEQTRPQFKGIQSKSPVDGRPYLYFSRLERTQRVIASTGAIMAFLLLVIGVIGAIFAVRVVMTLHNFQINGLSMAGVFSSFMLAVQIQVMNNIYSELALRLTNHENHRTGMTLSCLLT